ncbi:MAG: formyltetrahydrofolate deformylase [Phycisphaerales bacterium]|nr:formyltetrahydrofolate deformylase [Phycisphaerales bacterium]
MDASSPNEAVILLHCPDQPGIVARVANCLDKIGGNILDAVQHTDFESGTFLQRLHVSWPQHDSDEQVVRDAFTALKRDLNLNWRLQWSHTPRRVAIFVSREDHCLHDLLLLRRDGDLHCKISLIISNHADLEDVAKRFGVPYHHVPMEFPGDPDGEAEQLTLLKEHNIDLVVLARYMQVLSARFIAAYESRIINIHHSFLPAFAGGSPYRQAHEKGVKLIGATAHFATAALDDGPIIEQGVTRVSHRDSVHDMVRKGRDIERTVLARAVRWYLQDRVIVHKGRAVVFE